MAQSMTDQRAMRAGPGRNGLQELQFPAVPALGRGELGGTMKIILVQPLAFRRRKPGFRGVGVPLGLRRRRVGESQARFPGLNEGSPEVRDASGEGLCLAPGERGATH